MDEPNNPRSRENLIHHLGEKAMREADAIQNDMANPNAATWVEVSDERAGGYSYKRKDVAERGISKGKYKRRTKFFGTGLS